VIPPYVDQAWLADHPQAVLADVRWYLDGHSGRLEYAKGHLPGAVFVDLDRWLAAPAAPGLGRHPLPEPSVFAEGMSSLGISDADVVVAYDDDAGACAARLVWMLRSTGHDAALLDGGITAWQGPLTTEVPHRPQAAFTTAPWPTELIATIDDLGDVIIDARAGERYRGEVEPVDARPGHIPGAQSLPCRSNVGPDGRLLPEAELRTRFGTLTGPWVSSCGSGVNACQNLLVAEHLSLPRGRLYVGSYSQWAATDRPVETG
jgi:thiosulfate/3-mercaptopyruvate sulfurtransferase